MSKNKLDQLREFTTIVIDTGDIDAIKLHHPQDATTNPSLIFAAAQKPQYQNFIEDAVQYSKKNASSSDQVRTLMMDKLFVNFGVEILKHVPGRVSTEVDARLSFDEAGSIRKAHSLIDLYKQAGISKDRVLIKLASTWEGAKAATQLEKDGIHCNMTLMFSMPQAITCAEAKATLVSPFVGRILDWYKKSEGVSGYAAPDDPGVKSVKEIYNYFKKFGYKTQVMGASFRNIDELLELAGCDLLTISPQLLDELKKAEGTVEKKLDPAFAQKQNIEKINLDEKTYRWMLNENQMATQLLSSGIFNFSKDAKKLEAFICEKYKL